LFLVEDLHWVDPSTLELLGLLAEQGATAPLLLLFTTRPEFSAPWPSRAHHAQMTLNRLSRREARAMVTCVAGETPLPADTVETLVQRTDGVPLFIEELTRLVRQRGAGGGGDRPGVLVRAAAGRPPAARPRTAGGARGARRRGADLRAGPSARS